MNLSEGFQEAQKIGKKTGDPDLGKWTGTESGWKTEDVVGHATATVWLGHCLSVCHYHTGHGSNCPFHSASPRKSRPLIWAQCSFWAISISVSAEKAVQPTPIFCSPVNSQISC